MLPMQPTRLLLLPQAKLMLQPLPQLQPQKQVKQLPRQPMLPIVLIVSMIDF
uniref:Uncharacterized protein n=1 Tax=uncultured marine virus TaxID=186617 RepID=A0A0F7L1B2_9VIRU|nr:hypothetical protein [uncultured marine virus]